MALKRKLPTCPNCNRRYIPDDDCGVMTMKYDQSVPNPRQAAIIRWCQKCSKHIEKRLKALRIGDSSGE